MTASASAPWRRSDIRSMKLSSERILTTHVGSLPRSARVCELLIAKEKAQPYDKEVFERTMREEVAAVVKRQVEIGIDIVSDGETAKIGYKPQWATSNTLSDAPMMMGITKGLWAGMIHGNFTDVPSSNLPLMVKYRSWQQKYEPKERWGTFYFAGIMFAEPLVEGLRRAGRNLTPDSFVQAMESLKDWQGIGPPITYSPNERQGGKHVFYGQVQPDGTINKITDWVRITK